jgi:transposase
MPKRIFRLKRPLKKLREIATNSPESTIFFFDEGRFGLQLIVGKCWSRKGVRPMATVKTGYDNFYMYSAVSPATGEDVSLFLPWVNTAMMNVFLEALQKALNGRECLLVLDQAGWHSSRDLLVPQNIKLVYLPPYSPELNPVERLWQWLKRHSLRNQFHPNLESAMNAVQKCFQQTTRRFMMNLCRCLYLFH